MKKKHNILRCLSLVVMTTMIVTSSINAEINTKINPIEDNAKKAAEKATQTTNQVDKDKNQPTTAEALKQSIANLKNASNISNVTTVIDNVISYIDSNKLTDKTNELDNNKDKLVEFQKLIGELKIIKGISQDKSNSFVPRNLSIAYDFGILKEIGKIQNITGDAKDIKLGPFTIPFITEEVTINPYNYEDITKEENYMALSRATAGSNKGKLHKEVMNADLQYENSIKNNIFNILQRRYVNIAHISYVYMYFNPVKVKQVKSALANEGADAFACKSNQDDTITCTNEFYAVIDYISDKTDKLFYKGKEYTAEELNKPIISKNGKHAYKLIIEEKEIDGKKRRVVSKIEEMEVTTTEVQQSTIKKDSALEEYICDYAGSSQTICTKYTVKIDGEQTDTLVPYKYGDKSGEDGKKEDINPGWIEDAKKNPPKYKVMTEDLLKAKNSKEANHNAMYIVTSNQAFAKLAQVKAQKVEKPVDASKSNYTPLMKKEEYNKFFNMHKLFKDEVKSLQERGFINTSYTGPILSVNGIKFPYLVVFGDESKLLKDIGTIDGKYSEDNKYKNIQENFDFIDFLDKVNDSKLKDELRIKEDLSASVSQDQSKNDIVKIENGKIDMVAQLKAGIALSALYKPLVDNNYSNKYINIILSENDNVFKKWHATNGRIMKHLLISRETNAVTKYQSSRSISSLKIATLRDLIENPEREKLLVVSEQYYNDEDMIDGTRAVADETLRATDAAYEAKNKQIEKDAQDAEKAIEKGNEVPEAKADKIDLTNPNKYSTLLTDLQTWKDADFELSRKTVQVAKRAIALFESAVLDEEPSGVSLLNGMRQAKIILSTDAYLQTISAKQKEPIFMSSKNLRKETSNPNNYLNYVLLKGIHENLSSNYRHVIDLDAPLFADIYGNIITESGLVVIPSAANGSNKSKYNFLTVAWALNVKDFEIPKEIDIDLVGYNNITEWIKPQNVQEMKVIETYEKDNKKYGKMNSLEIAGTTDSITLDELDLASEGQTILIYKLNKELYEKLQIMNMERYVRSYMYPISKGAYPEMIDYAKENIEGLDGNTKIGLRQALKLENFIDSVGDITQNTLFSVPDIRFSKMFGYIFYNLIRLLIIIVTLLLLMEIYSYSVRFKFSVLFFIQFIGSIGAILAMMFTFPIIYNLAYTYSKVVMQDSLMHVAMINQERAKSEMEIGVIEGKDPTKSSSKLLLKLGEDNVTWKKLVLNMMDDGDIETANKILNDNSNDSPFIESQEFEKYVNMHFIDVQKLFNSSIIATDMKTGVMKQYVNEGSGQSFYLPYYVMVDYIIRNINDYNTLSKENSASFVIANDGLYRSIGRTTNYFRSDAFLITNRDMRKKSFKAPERINQQVLNLASMDKAGIAQIYNLKTADTRDIPEITAQMSAIQQSAWYNASIPEDKDFVGKVDKLDREAIKFMITNSASLGRMTDETIIKTLALHLSLKYNEIFNLPLPRMIDLYKVDTHDIVRTYISTARQGTIYSSYSYANFIYRLSGMFGVVIAFILELTTLLCGALKSIMLVEIMIAFTISLIFHRMIAKDKVDEMVKGFFKTILITTSTNFLYALFVNLTSNLTIIGTAPIICLIYMVIITTIYISIMLNIIVTLILNFKDLGNSYYNNTFEKAILKASSIPDRVQKVQIVNKIKEAPRNGWDVYRNLKDKMNRTGRGE